MVVQKGLKPSHKSWYSSKHNKWSVVTRYGALSCLKSPLLQIKSHHLFCLLNHLLEYHISRETTEKGWHQRRKKPTIYIHPHPFFAVHSLDLLDLASHYNRVVSPYLLLTMLFIIKRTVVFVRIPMKATVQATTSTLKPCNDTRQNQFQYQ